MGGAQGRLMILDRSRECGYFRVDNPHTKAFAFWEWAIRIVREAHPDVIFLAEAFTRPRVMYQLYKAQLHAVLHLLHVAQYQGQMRLTFSELAKAPQRDFFRANLWPNTPDILPEVLQVWRAACLHDSSAPGTAAGRQLVWNLRTRLRAYREHTPRTRRGKSISTRKSMRSSTGIGTRRATSRTASPASTESDRDNRALQSDR